LVCHINERAYAGVFDNRVPTKEFGPKGEEIALRGGKRKLQNEKHHDFYW
jgi:hypothetical protein